MTASRYFQRNILKILSLILQTNTATTQFVGLEYLDSPLAFGTHFRSAGLIFYKQSTNGTFENILDLLVPRMCQHQRIVILKILDISLSSVYCMPIAGFNISHFFVNLLFYFVFWRLYFLYQFLCRSIFKMGTDAPKYIGAHTILYFLKNLRVSLQSFYCIIYLSDCITVFFDSYFAQ